MKTAPGQMCEFCDGVLEQRLVRARFHYKGQTIYIDRVPAWVCRRCGQQEFDGPVYERMEEIAKDPRQFTGTIAFPLASYGVAEPASSAKAEEPTPTGHH